MAVKNPNQKNSFSLAVNGKLISSLLLFCENIFKEYAKANIKMVPNIIGREIVKSVKPWLEMNRLKASNLGVNVIIVKGRT